MNTIFSLRVLFLSLLLSISLLGKSQTSPSPQFYLDSIFQLAQATSVVRNEVDWTAIKKEYDLLSVSAKTDQDIIPAVKYLLKSHCSVSRV